MLIRIMACKEREDNVNKIISSLGKEAEPIWDTDHNACHTLCRVLDSDESMIVMEDDIELCKNFYDKAMKEINERPNSFIMFYSMGHGDKMEAINREKGLPYNRKFVFTQAYYVPEGIGKKLSKFLETNPNANHRRWSIGINEFLVQEGIDRYLVYPNLVQHISKTSILEPNSLRKIHTSPSYKYE